MSYYGGPARPPRRTDETTIMRATLFGLALAALISSEGPVWSQVSPDADRRVRRDPEFTLDTGGRTGPCDVILFADDGRAVLAAGDDRVIYEWGCTERGLADRPRVLRWPSWREERGGIKALAVSPDGRRVAVGGKGIITDFIAVFDRGTGEVVARTAWAIHHPKEPKKLYPV